MFSLFILLPEFAQRGGVGDDQGVAGAAVLAQAGARIVLIVATGVRGTGSKDGEEVNYEQRQATRGGEHLLLAFEEFGRAALDLPAEKRGGAGAMADGVFERGMHLRDAAIMHRGVKDAVVAKAVFALLGLANDAVPVGFAD